MAGGDLPEFGVPRIIIGRPVSEGRSTATAGRVGSGTLNTTVEDDRVGIRQQIALAPPGIGMRDKALKIWRDLAAEDPGELSARLMIVELAAQEQDESAIVDCLADIRRIEGPNGPNGDFVESSLLIQKASRDRVFIRDLGRAGGLLRQSGKLRPSWPAVPRMMGLLEDILGNRDEALDHYRKAVELGDRSPQAINLLVGHLYEQQRYDEADLKLRQLAEQQSGALTGELARLASNVAWERHEFDRALHLAGEVADSSRDFRDLIRLSQLRFAQNERGEQVEKPLRDAIDLAPDQPEPHRGFVTLLTNEVKDAEAAIQQASQSLPAAVAHLTAARCFDVINARKEAKENYANAGRSRTTSLS